MNEVEIKKEFSEINRIIESCKHHGNYSVQSSGKNLFIPVIMSNDCRDQVIESLAWALTFCYSQLKKTQNDLLIHCPNKKNERLDPIEFKIKRIYSEFIKKLKNKPYCIQKADIDSLSMLQDDAKKFTKICSYIF